MDRKDIESSGRHESMFPDRLDNLQIIHWPDPRLNVAGAKIEVFDERLKALAERMIELMYEANGL